MNKAEEIVSKVFDILVRCGELSPHAVSHMDTFNKDIWDECLKEVSKIIDPLGTALRTREENHHKDKLEISDWDYI